ncbi:MAG TPA: hypothetical protein VKS21_06805 [Spirochaetota bacterium]|nr:hypothetical protein [Spirochaetota bacterium]
MVAILFFACTSEDKLTGRWLYKTGYQLPGVLESRQNSAYTITFSNNIYTTTFLQDKPLKGYYVRHKLSIMFWSSRQQYLEDAAPSAEWYNVSIRGDTLKAIKRNGGPIELEKQ